MKSKKKWKKMELGKLREIQTDLAKKAIISGKFNAEYIAGVDQAFIEDIVISACVILKSDMSDMKKICEVTHWEKTEMPYIPTYLMFREGSSAINAVKLAIEKAGIGTNRVCLFVDGSGIAHPRKCGLATYIGVKLNVQSIGITKKKLYGEVKQPEKVLESNPIFDFNKNIIGYSIKTCKICKPIYVSPGHLISPQEALKAVKYCLRGYKLPEPIRLAHNLASSAKSKIYKYYNVKT